MAATACIATLHYTILYYIYTILMTATACIATLYYTILYIYYTNDSYCMHRHTGAADKGGVRHAWPSKCGTERKGTIEPAHSCELKSCSSWRVDLDMVVAVAVVVR